MVSDESNDNRQLSLTNRFCIDGNCLVKCGTNPDTIQLPFIDYNIVNEQLKKQRDFSISFLKDSLE